MALTIYVEDQTHTRVRTLSDDPDNTFLGICRRLAASGTAVLDVIDPYTDTMLNFIQLDRLIGELRTALNGDGLTAKEKGAARLVLAAAIEARELSGYLLFEGD